MIFISYRKSDSRDLVDRLGTDLAREFGEDLVFRDESRLQGGHDWTHELEENAQNCRVMLVVIGATWQSTSFTEGDFAGWPRLSDPQDWVRKEITLALDAGNIVIPVFLNDTTIPSEGWLAKCRLERLYKQQGERLRSNDYANDLEKLIVVLKKQCPELPSQPAKGRATGASFPPPETFETYLESKRTHFCGRKWVFDEIQIWVHSQAPHLSLIKGDPGTGKSAIIAECIHRFSDRVLAYHFCEREHRDWLSPGRFVHNLASMLSRNLPQFAERIAGDQILKKWHNEDDCENDPISAFYSLIVTPLREIPAPEDGKQFILVDALDEALAVGERSKTIIDVLAKHYNDLPDWIRVIATTRNRVGIPRRFSHHEIRIDVKNSCNLDDVLDDVEEYLDKRLSEPKLLQKLKECERPAPEIRQMLLEKSEGVFLDLQQTLQGIEDGAYDFDRLEELPPGLGNLYLAWFENQFPVKTEFATAKCILQAVTAACQPLTRNELALVTDLDEDEELQPVLMQLSVYLPGRDGQYSFYHQRFREWLTGSDLRDDPLGTWCHISENRGHKMLAECGLKLLQNQKRRMPGYFRKYLPEHLIATQHWEELQQALCNPDLFEEMWDQGRKYVWMQYWQTLRLHENVDSGSAYGLSLEELIGREGESERVSRLADLIGSFLRDMGEKEAAKPFLERALRLSEQAFGKEHPETATRMHNLAELYRLIGQEGDEETHRKSLPLFEEALRIRELIFTGDHVDIATSFHNLAEYYHDQGNFDQALKHYQQSLEICERILDPNHPKRADNIHDIGYLYFDLGTYCMALGLAAETERNFNKALSRFDQAKAIYDTAYGSRNPESATADLNIASIYAKRKDYAKAIEVTRQSLEIFKKTLSESHHKVREAYRRFAEFYRRDGQMADSLQCAQEHFRLGLKALGKGHRSTAGALFNLAATHVVGGNPDAAEKCLRDFLDVGNNLRNEDRLRLADGIDEVVKTCIDWKDTAKAIPLCERSLELQEQFYGPMHPELCSTIGLLARLYLSDNRNQDSLALLKRLLSLRESYLPASHLIIAETREALAAVYEKVLRFEDAEREYKRILDLRSDAEDAGPVEPVRYLFSLKELYGKQARHEESASVGEQILSICRSHPEELKSSLPSALNNLGYSYVRLGRYSDSMPLLQEAIELYREFGSDSSPTINNLAEAYLGLGDYQKAEEHCRNSLALREQSGDPRRLAVSQTTLATILQSTGELDEAEAWYRKAIENHEPPLPDFRHYRLETLNRYVAFLRMCNRDTEAEKWQDQINSEQTLLSNPANQQLIQ